MLRRNLMRYFLVILFLFSTLYGERIRYVDVRDAASGEVIQKIQQADLDAGMEEFVLFDPYVKKDTRFSGIPLKDFAKKYCPNAMGMTMTAVDYYKIDFEKSEWENESIYVVTKENGSYITPKNRGPMRIVYKDYDKDKLGDLGHFIKWIWMIKEVSCR